MPVGNILFYSFSIAFFVVELLPKKIRFQNMKPFNCLGCLTGWTSLCLSLLVNRGLESVLIMFAGVLVGSLFEAVKMKWL